MECFHFSQLPSEFYSILFYIIKWNTFSSSLYSLYPSSPPPCLANELFPRKRRSIKTFHSLSLSRSHSFARLDFASNCSFNSHSDVVASFPFPFRTPYLHLCTAATYIKRQKYCQALPFVCEFLKQLKELPPSSPPSPSPSQIETSILRSALAFFMSFTWLSALFLRPSSSSSSSLLLSLCLPRVLYYFHELILPKIY